MAGIWLCRLLLLSKATTILGMGADSKKGGLSEVRARQAGRWRSRLLLSEVLESLSWMQIQKRAAAMMAPKCDITFFIQIE
jgi:hypothetical protein